jgi:hypothetical protein
VGYLDPGVGEPPDSMYPVADCTVAKRQNYRQFNRLGKRAEAGWGKRGRSRRGLDRQTRHVGSANPILLCQSFHLIWLQVNESEAQVKRIGTSDDERARVSVSRYRRRPWRTEASTRTAITGVSTADDMIN